MVQRVAEIGVPVGILAGPPHGEDDSLDRGHRPAAKLGHQVGDRPGPRRRRPRRKQPPRKTAPGTIIAAQGWCLGIFRHASYGFRRRFPVRHSFQGEECRERQRLVYRALFLEFPFHQIVPPSQQRRIWHTEHPQ